MSNVTLQIGGRSYTVACAAGEEAHVEGLGQVIDGKVHDLVAAGHNEARSLLFAALMLADEVHELRGTGGSSATTPAAPSDPHAAALEGLAARLEKYAAALER